YVDARALIRTSFMKLFSLEDGNNTPIVNIYKNGSVWIKGLKKDIATYINSLNQNVELLNSLLSITAGSNIIEIRDFNNVPVFSINKALDVNIGKYKLSLMSDALNTLKSMVFKN
ncbi:exo-alpha-sialidase, partial [Acinetobacter baumannii]|nr:exo-alpha-sialidase [Acinetobacter baumannii]MDC4140288.1 exo-alpha-sialidase [Acinetobacter baumannii]